MKSKTYIMATFLLLISLRAVGQEKLVLAIDIVRHGDRNPDRELANSPTKLSKNDLGQLTLVGAEKAFKLGGFFREKYIHQYGLLPKIYKRDMKSHGPVTVFSTNYDRTFMTAEAIIQGLYPLEHRKQLLLPNTNISIYSQIPIATLDWPLADINEFINSIGNPYLFSNSEWNKKNHFLKTDKKIQLKNWEEKLGVKFDSKGNTLFKLAEIGDDIKVYQKCGLVLPTKLNDDDIQSIVSINEWVFIRACSIKESANFIAKPTLQKIIEYLELANEGKTPVKYILFASHDLVIASILTILNNSLSELPSYLDNLNFLIFENSEGDYILKIYYDNKQISVCGCAEKNEDFCYLDKFLEEFKKETRFFIESNKFEFQNFMSPTYLSSQIN